jgi:hypothetical protein
MDYLMTSDAIDPARTLPLYTEAFACAERSGDHLITPSCTTTPAMPP